MTGKTKDDYGRLGMIRDDLGCLRSLRMTRED